MVEIEEYLDNTLSHGIEKDIETPTAMVHDELRTTIKEFSNKLEESLKEITDVLSYRFAAAASGMEEFSASLSESVDKFDKSLQTFAENTRDFSEFNHHLRTNIQRMNVAFDDFTEDLKTGTKDLEKGYILIGQLSKSVEELAGKIDK
jgi:methyl-accepting chemotaxis protein